MSRDATLGRPARITQATNLVKCLAFTVVFAISSPAQAGFSECLGYFPQRHVPQLPAGLKHTVRALCFDGFAILYSASSKTPVYAVERLTRGDFEDALKLKRGRNPFYPEARLTADERSSLDDYKTVLPDGSRMDRGHVVPAGDMTSATAFAQTFSLANMVPQVPRANQGPWNQIEQDTRHFVRRAKAAVFIFTGPVYGRQPVRLGAGLDTGGHVQVGLRHALQPGLGPLATQQGRCSSAASNLIRRTREAHRHPLFAL